MTNNFNTFGGSCNSPKLEEVQTAKSQTLESLKLQAASLKDTNEFLSWLKLDPQLEAWLKRMRDEINANIEDLIGCESSIIAANDEITEANTNVIPLSTHRKRPIFEELKKYA